MNTNNGWKLVPERATKAMQDAWDTAPFSEDTDAEFHGAYAAMIAAAPASAQPERDWELTCEDCDGDGFVYVERRVGMCATDVQTFKEDCECCDGRGFTIAFQDIPGIAEYVKSCRPASTVADEGAKDGKARWYAVDRDGAATLCTCEEDARDTAEESARMFPNCAPYTAVQLVPAPAAGDALDSVMVLPDGSGCALASFPLPTDHWLYAAREYAPGAEEPKELPPPILTHAQRDAVVAAIRYAVRGATMCGKEQDFDPDALVQNAVYALCGPYGAAISAQRQGDA
ncbi:MAG: hypothetical protein ACWGIK_00665 [Achromobacter pulmonis]